MEIINTFFLAFMAEFHKMASVITGLGQCFKQENSDCELENRNTHYIVFTCIQYMYTVCIMYDSSYRHFVCYPIDERECIYMYM